MISYQNIMYICIQAIFSTTNLMKSKKNVPLRLDLDLFELAKAKANAEKRSFNNYVEYLIFKDVGNIPNDITKKAIEELRKGHGEEIKNLHDWLDSL